MKTLLPKIFISIASYNDAELIPTIMSLISQADHPERLSIAVCWQNDNSDLSLFLNAGIEQQPSPYNSDDKYLFALKGAAIKVHYVHTFHSQGACWARYQAEKFFNNEDYFLQIDSHCRFAESWDVAIIKEHSSLKEISSKPIMSSYPAPYVPATEDKPEDKGNLVARLIFSGFDDQKIPSFNSTYFTEFDKPILGSFIAAGFIFAEGVFAKELPNDPSIFFLGEEISLSARAFTRGYDVYHPTKIFLWHYYERKECKKIWNDHSNEVKDQGHIDKAWWERDNESKKRVRHLLGIEISEDCDLGIYGLGNVRTLSEFEYHCGVYFKERRIHPDLMKDNKPSSFEKNTLPHQEWLDLLYSSYHTTLSVSKNELYCGSTDLLYWQVGVYNKNNEIISLSNLLPDELNNYKKAGSDDLYEINIKFKEHIEISPSNIKIFPFRDNNGWGEALEKPW